jgi:ubiquinone/menaquinone biosynthesis C-methylase UbiE
MPDPLALAMIAAVPASPLTLLASAVLHVPAPERALAVQCGDGDPALFLAREFPSARVRGIDSSPARMQTATERVGLDPEGRIAFKVGGPRRLPFPDDFFDLVAHLGGRPAPAEISRVLQPGGHLILVVPRPPRMARGGREKLLRARFGRQGIAFVHAADGNFFIGRLEDGTPPDPAV